MKRVLFIRHAKSSWNEATQLDIDRPLNERGKRDAPFMGKVLKQNDALPELIISSPAKRAKSTAKRIAKEIGMDTQSIQIENRLYLGSTYDYEKTVHEVDNRFDTVAIVSHNPAITAAAEDFTDVEFANIPTGGIVAVDFNIDNWSELSTEGSLHFFEYPKKYYRFSEGPFEDML
tara:strand:- start:1415 stop:1939 length:525 start_codon:yes stop_codon:yes gene_type:complete